MLLQLQAIADSLVKTKIQQNEHVSDIKDADHLDKIELQNIHNFATIKRFIRAKNKKETEADIVRLLNRFDLCEIKELHTKLVMTPVKKKKE